MNIGLFQAASALTTNGRWQEIISNNLASASVPGFKGQNMMTSAVKAGLSPLSNIFSSFMPHSALVPQGQTTTNFQPGQVKYTGNKSDVAIDGKGFFSVQLSNGQTGYTRNGEFQINSHGQLVTNEGYPVQGAQGPITVNLQDSSPIQISPTGQVSQGASIKGTLQLTDFDNPSLLTQVSGAYFTAQNANIHASPSTTSSVRQGYLETSNTSTVSEMSNLIGAMRGFEANQHVIQLQDDRLGKTISELGSTS